MANPSGERPEKEFKIPEPSASVYIFYQWCLANNQMLKDKDTDVLGCVKEWEETLTEDSNIIIKS